MKINFKSIADFKRVYAGYFFTRKTMRFFNSRIESSILKGRYFITSEQYSQSDNRQFTLREISIDLNGDYSINTIGDFQRFRSKESAKEYLKELFTKRLK